jgi:hypothetical protein
VSGFSAWRMTMILVAPFVGVDDMGGLKTV